MHCIQLSLSSFQVGHVRSGQELCKRFVGENITLLSAEFLLHHEFARDESAFAQLFHLIAVILHKENSFSDAVVSDAEELLHQRALHLILINLQSCQSLLHQEINQLLITFGPCLCLFESAIFEEQAVDAELSRR
jgi:hypothetical protein